MEPRRCRNYTDSNIVDRNYTEKYVTVPVRIAVTITIVTLSTSVFANEKVRNRIRISTCIPEELLIVKNV